MDIIKSNYFFNFKKLYELVFKSLPLNNTRVFSRIYANHVEVVVIHNSSVHGFLIFEQVDDYFRLTRHSFKDDHIQLYYDKRRLIKMTKEDSIKGRESWTL